MRVIDPASGMLATDFCPRREREWFKPGSEPQLPCTLHGQPFENQTVDNGENIPQGVGDILQSIGKGIGKLKKISRFRFRRCGARPPATASRCPSPLASASGWHRLRVDEQVAAIDLRGRIGRVA